MHKATFILRHQVCQDCECFSYVHLVICDVCVNVQLLARVARERSHGVFRQPDQEYTLILASKSARAKSIGIVSAMLTEYAK